MTEQNKKIGQVLLKAGLINEEQMNEALSKNGKPLAETIIDMGFATETQIVSALAQEMKVPYVDLSNYDINLHAATSIPREVALKHKVLPIDYENNMIVVAMFDPTNVIATDDIKIITGYDVKHVICTETDINNAIINTYKTEQDFGEVVDSVGGAEDVEVSESDESDTGGVKSPVVKMIDSLLMESVRQRANDIHIEPQEDGVRIRYRIDGVLKEVTYAPKKMQSGMISRLKILSGMDIAERRVPQDGRFGLRVDGKPVDFRVASLPTVHGEKIVLRLLEKENILMEIEELGMDKDSIKLFKESFTKPYGAILVTGPTGCGKTTTLYGALNILNAIEKNLITVEDPVEYKLDGVNQVQINVRAGMTFAAGLRSILRNDPDIVMIGEIRDRETAQIAVESALTGHLVLSTLHTNDAVMTLTRLIEMGVEPFLIASAVDCIVAQRLARRLCPHCKEEYEAPKEIFENARIKLPDSGIRIFKAVGCKRCGNTGYRGRVGVFELLRMDENIERYIVKRASNEEIVNAARYGSGMVTLKEDGLRKVLNGLTSIEEVERVTV